MNQVPRNLDIVILYERHPGLCRFGLDEVYKLLNNVFAGVVSRVRLAGDDNLHGSFRMEKDVLQTNAVRKHQTRPLVRGEASSEADRKHARIEYRADGVEIRLCNIEPLLVTLNPLAYEANQVSTLVLAHGPKIFVRYGVDAGPRGRVEFRVYDLPFLGDGSRLTAGGELSWDDPRGVQGKAACACAFR